MSINVKFTRISGNSKTGPIPTSMSASSTCPDSCGLKDNGCYAKYGMVGMHWRKTDKGENVKSWNEFCAEIKALPKGTLWRHNVAGDLPFVSLNSGQNISHAMMFSLIDANKGKQGFTYTHHDMAIEPNRMIVSTANYQGFTVNLSADTMAQADKLKSLNIGPVVCIMPEDAEKITHTPNGNTVILCPATYNDSVNCANCGICATQRKAIIGFPVHGSGRKKAAKVFMMKVEGQGQ